MRIRWTVPAAALLAIIWPGTGRAADQGVLWAIVHDRCVPERQRGDDPKPCVAVSLPDGAGRGYAVLKDLNGMAQFLLIPTVRIAGIGDPAVLAPDAVNYFDAAWDARPFVEGVLRRALPRDGLGLVANAVPALSQDQLHLHVDCLRGEVREAMRDNAAEIGPDWSPMPVPLAGRRYRAMRVPGERLGGNNPFKLLAERVPGARDEMGLHTLVVVGVGTEGNPGFVILDRRASPEAGDTGHGTELLDRACGLDASGSPASPAR